MDGASKMIILSNQNSGRVSIHLPRRVQYLRGDGGAAPRPAMGSPNLGCAASYSSRGAGAGSGAGWSTRLRIWGSAVRIHSGAPVYETFRAIRTAIARRKVPVGDWAGTQAHGSVSGAADYESGGREFESLRARQHLEPAYRAKNTAILRNLQGTELALILRLMHLCIGPVAGARA
jgi:hypothetical protein